MPLPRLVLATNNPGKVREFRELLAGCGFELSTPAELGTVFEVEETGATFEENARLKAAAAAQLTGLPALADDSGLEVDALDGRPGIYSARYAGPGRTGTLSESEQCQLVLGELAGIPDERRTARFRCVIAIALPGGTMHTTEGAFEGRIAHAPRGDRGFGYDPIFLVPERGVTSAELPPAEKNALSHRGQAAREACRLLKELKLT
jgi:XTP/dITP diphosphohydrolase